MRDVKIGEGTYANVYKGGSLCHIQLSYPLAEPYTDPQPTMQRLAGKVRNLGVFARSPLTPRLSRSPTVAIKKIKTGAFKDGIDISAIREVKFLRELSHPNVVAVRPLAGLPSPAASSSSLNTTGQLLNVFSTGRNINLVLEYLDTDLEAVIKDKALIFQTADVKSWMAMSLRGLEFCHRHGVLHRVRPCARSAKHRAGRGAAGNDAVLTPPATGSQAQQLAHLVERRAQAGGFRSRARVWRAA